MEQSPATIELEQSTRPRLVAIGGGHGASVMAEGLVAHMPEADLTVIVSVSDSGSKTGEIRDQYGGVAVGDLRRVLAAVSGNDAGKLFEKRFSDATTLGDINVLGDRLVAAVSGGSQDRAAVVLERVRAMAQELDENGGLYGHTYGNLILTALRLDHEDDISLAVHEAGRWLEARATVLPATSEVHDLVLDDGPYHLVGEGALDEHEFVDPETAKLSLTNPTDIDLVALGALADADVAFTGPGSLWTSLMAVESLRDFGLGVRMMRANGGKRVFVGNILQDQSTRNMPLRWHVQRLEAQSGADFDCVLYNTTTVFGETAPVVYGSDCAEVLGSKAIGAALAAAAEAPGPNDPIAHLRSKAQHDVEPVAYATRERILQPA
jgi:uncharacterized cofD-like protein